MLRETISSRHRHARAFSSRPRLGLNVPTCHRSRTFLSHMHPSHHGQVLPCRDGVRAFAQGGPGERSTLQWRTVRWESGETHSREAITLPHGEMGRRSFAHPCCLRRKSRSRRRRATSWCDMCNRRCAPYSPIGSVDSSIRIRDWVAEASRPDCGFAVALVQGRE